MNIIILGQKGVGKTHLAIEIENHLLPGAILHNDVSWLDVPKTEPRGAREDSHIFVVKAGSAPQEPVLPCSAHGVVSMPIVPGSGRGYQDVYLACKLSSHSDAQPHEFKEVRYEDWVML